MTKPFRAMPAYAGFPVFGAAWEFARNLAWDVTARLGREVGPICRVSLLGTKMVVLNDPDAIGYVLEEHPELFYKGAPGPALRPLATDASMFIQEGGERWQRAHDANPMAAAIGDGWLESILPDLQALVSTRIDRWLGATGERPLEDTFDALRHLAFNAYSRTLFGEAFDDSMYRRFVYMGNGLDFRIKWPLPLMPPLPPWRASAIRIWSDSLTDVVVRRRQQSPADGRDLLSRTVREGVNTPPDVFAAQLANLYYGGAFSMSTAIAATLFELGRHPEALARVQSAVDALLEGGPLTRDALLGCTPLQAAIREAMRVKPPVAIFTRQVSQDAPVVLGGYDVPAGTTLLISCKHLHMTPEHWDAPQDYRPSRWMEGAMERDPLGSGYFFPFGRGARACYGQEYALVYISLAVALMLGRSRPEVGQGQAWREAFWFGCMVPRRLRSRFLPRGRREPLAR